MIQHRKLRTVLCVVYGASLTVAISYAVSAGSNARGLLRDRELAGIMGHCGGCGLCSDPEGWDRCVAQNNVECSTGSSCGIEVMYTNVYGRVCCQGDMGTRCVFDKRACTQKWGTVSNGTAEDQSCQPNYPEDPNNTWAHYYDSCQPDSGNTCTKCTWGLEAWPREITYCPWDDCVTP